jgi:hypothetical protein
MPTGIIAVRRVSGPGGLISADMRSAMPGLARPWAPPLMSETRGARELGDGTPEKRLTADDSTNQRASSKKFTKCEDGPAHRACQVRTETPCTALASGDPSSFVRTPVDASRSGHWMWLTATMVIAGCGPTVANSVDAGAVGGVGGQGTQRPPGDGTGGLAGGAADAGGPGGGGIDAGSGGAGDAGRIIDALAARDASDSGPPPSDAGAGSDAGANLVSIFDGSTLDGWIQVPPSSWSVVGGAMHSLGTARDSSTRARPTRTFAWSSPRAWSRIRRRTCPACSSGETRPRSTRWRGSRSSRREDICGTTAGAARPPT